MNIPDKPLVTSLESMKVTTKFTGQIKGEVDEPKEVFVKNIIDAINEDIKKMAKCIAQFDNKPKMTSSAASKDFNDTPGNVSIMEDNNGKKIAYIENFSPQKDNKPEIFQFETGDGKRKGSVLWDKYGDIYSMKQVYEGDAGTEIVTITRNDNVTTYTQDYTPKS